MRLRNAGLIADPLFIGATRPSMLWGVTYSAVMLNAMCIMELFFTDQKPPHSAPGGADPWRLHAALRPRCAFFRSGAVVGPNPTTGVSGEPSVLEGK